MGNTKVKSARATIDMCWHLMLLLAFTMGVSMLPDMALAGGAGPGATTTNAIEAVFCNLVIMMTGVTGKAIATIAIIAVGIGALLGKISWGMALIVALGVALIFGAATIVQALGGGSETCTGTSLIAS